MTFFFKIKVSEREIFQPEPAVLSYSKIYLSGKQSWLQNKIFLQNVFLQQILQTCSDPILYATLCSMHQMIMNVFKRAKITEEKNKHKIQVNHIHIQRKIKWLLVLHE